jgi:hypothetical protein
MIGWSVATSREQDGLVHSGNQSAHDVGVNCIRVVRRSWFGTCRTSVIVVNITTVGVTVVPILSTFVGSARINYLMLTTARAAKIHGWLLWETTVVALTATIVFVVIDERALLLSGVVATAYGLLANSHEELLDVCKLVLHCNKAVGLALHGFLRGSIHRTKVCKQVTVQCNQHVVVHGGHTVLMLQGWDSSLVDECNLVGPIFLKGVDHLDNRWECILAQDPIFVLLGIHSTMLDDTQANVNDVTVVHQVACSAGVGSADEEVCCKGLKTFGGVPGGGHSLPIFLAIFSRGMPIFHDEPVKHVEKDSVWLLHVDWLVCFTNCFW